MTSSKSIKVLRTWKKCCCFCKGGTEGFSEKKREKEGKESLSLTASIYRLDIWAHDLFIFKEDLADSFLFSIF